MKSAPTILFCTGSDDDPSPGWILINEFGTPPILGKIVTYPSHIALLTAIAEREPFAYFQVPGYSIIVAYNGVIGANGQRLNVQPDTQHRLTKIMERMARWYLEHKCQRHASRFRRYEIK